MSIQAFDIELAGNLSALVSDKQPLNTSVTCLEVCGDFLFVGCKEGSVLRCCFKKAVNSGLQSVMLSKSTHSTIMNNSVVQMKALSALNQLLVLSDDTLSILDLDTLSLVRHLKFKNVCTFCLNENPLSEDPFTVEICISVRKKILFVHLSDEICKLVKEFSIQTTPTALAMDGVHICFAVGLEYCMLDILTGEIQQLFLRDTPEQIPLIHRVSKGEFLLCGPGGVGMFVSTEGFSIKPPISFPSFVSALAYHHPYIIAVTDQGISFYSIMDQKSKQTIAISNVRCLVNGDGQIFASSSIDLFALLPISWEVQLEKLLLEDRLEEALQLASTAHISSSTKQRHQELLALLEQKAALKRFSSAQFSEAMELFETCNIDPREVIKINLDDMFSEETHRDQAKLFLLDFLQRWRVKSLSPDQKQAVDTALLRHLAAQDQEGIQLADLVADCDVDPEEVRSLLESHRKFHCLAVHYASRKEWDTALGTWEKLVKQELNDPHFPGPAFMADQLTKSGDVSLIWRFSGSILKIDQTVGCRIFTELFRHSDRPAASLAIKPTAVIEYLSDFPQSLKMFLEFLVNEKKGDEGAAVQTQLAILYIEEIGRSDPQRNSPGQRLTVNKLRSLLRTAQMLDLARLSGILQTPRFPHEYAIVCGRLGHHSAAIKIFIEQLQDFDAAEEYCACVDDPKAWNCLLTACVSRETQGSTFDRMIDLLRRRPNQFDVASALLCLPNETRFDVIAPFINFAMRETLHEKRMKMIEKALHQMDNLASRYQLATLESESFTLQPSSYCCVCKKQFSATAGFTRFPNGVVVHVKCAPNKHICPLTGHLFQVDSQN